MGPELGIALSHPSAKLAKQGPGIPVFGKGQSWVSTGCGWRIFLTTRLSISEPHCPCRQAWSLLDTL